MGSSWAEGGSRAQSSPEELDLGGDELPPSISPVAQRTENQRKQTENTEGGDSLDHATASRLLPPVPGVSPMGISNSDASGFRLSSNLD